MLNILAKFYLTLMFILVNVPAAIMLVLIAAYLTVGHDIGYKTLNTMIQKSVEELAKNCIELVSEK